MSYEHDAGREYPLGGGSAGALGGVHATPYQAPGDGYGDGWHIYGMGDGMGANGEAYRRQVRDPYPEYREGPRRG